jgi:hypothetical protein
MKMGILQLQAKKYQDLPEAGKGKADFSLEP